VSTELSLTAKPQREYSGDFQNQAGSHPRPQKGGAASAMQTTGNEVDRDKFRIAC
jgi:hypothetical protein